ncbi:hypothetical protein [Novilysobacter erysipheiresistens]|uniref:Uncharacterized protein n=1 Tax=Novilysobacter erysipheiresistens TaxID=1749332 RepID=A0ABU7YU94_9GAMM
MKPETHWFITGRCGLYYLANASTRHDAIHSHCDSLGMSWQACRKNGDRAIKCVITPKDATNGQE